MYTNFLRVYNSFMSTLDHLALHGGTPVIQSPFIGYSTIDQTDALVVQRVIDSGSLSQFIGDAGDYFASRVPFVEP